MELTSFVVVTRAPHYDPVRFTDDMVSAHAFPTLDEAASTHNELCRNGCTTAILAEARGSLTGADLVALPSRILDDTVRAHLPELDTEWAELDDHRPAIEDRVSEMRLIVAHPRPAGFTTPIRPKMAATPTVHADAGAPTSAPRIRWEAPAAVRLKAAATTPVAERLMERPLPALDLVIEVDAFDPQCPQDIRWTVRTGSGIRAYRPLKGAEASAGVDALFRSGCLRMEGRWVAPLPHDVEHHPEIRREIHDLIAADARRLTSGGIRTVTLGHTEGGHWSALGISD